MTVVLSAIGTAASGALSGAGGEMGRRSSEALFGLVRRAMGASARADGEASSRTEEDTDQQPVLPVTEDERRVLAARIRDHARRSPEFAREVMQWARETEWLAPRVIPAVSHTASCPQMLLPTPPAFTDRDWVTDEITRLLDEGRPPGAPVVVALSGPGGIGKSATATNCAHLLKDRFPDGRLYVNLAGASGAVEVSPSDALARFLGRLGVPTGRMPADEEELAELYRDCTAGRRMVVVLDNASSESQVRPLLPATSECLVIITSRLRLGGLVGAGAHPIVLPPLSATDSVRLLTRIAGRQRVADEDAGGLAVVAERCAGNPLALCTTGASVAFREHLTWETVGRQLSERADNREQGAFTMDGGASRDVVHSTHDVIYRQLRPQCAALYRALGVWTWPSITVGAAVRATAVSEAETRTLLEELAAVHLIEEIGEERYRFHDLVREHAYQKAEAEDGFAGMAAVVRRMANWYLGFAAQADLRVIPLRWRLGPAYLRLTLPENRDPNDGRAALAELRQERENLAAAVRAAERYGFDELVWQLCEAMWALHLRLGFHAQWVATHLIGLAAARRCAAEFGDPRAVGRMLVQLGFAYMGLGRVREAEEVFLQAAAADERAGHHRGRASAVEALGLLRLKRWKYAEAEACFKEAQRILGRIRPGGDDGAQDLPRALALLEHHLGRALSGQRLFADASSRLHGALAQFRALEGGDLYNEARVYMSLGETRLNADDPHIARVCLDKALTAMDQEGAELQYADAVELRSRCARKLGNPADEAEDLRVAAALYEQAEDWVSRARARARLEELGELGE
jgi:tetratricopeptide (TPR) repeat protein